jgi:putative membrane protein
MTSAAGHKPPHAWALACVRAACIAFVAFVAAVAGARAFGAILGVGPLSLHMLEHMALLSIAAPITGLALPNASTPSSGRALAFIAGLQIALLWTWHLPPVFSQASDSRALHLLMSGSLYGAGVWFWSAIQRTNARDRWQAVMALLLTGKLFCLFAAILVFAPRLLYSLDTHAHFGHGGVNLADQQLAGLIMITVCPLTYVAAGIVIAVRCIGALSDHEPQPGSILSRAQHVPAALIVPLSTTVGGCEGVRSALQPASTEASI